MFSDQRSNLVNAKNDPSLSRFKKDPTANPQVLIQQRNKDGHVQTGRQNLLMKDLQELNRHAWAAIYGTLHN